MEYSAVTALIDPQAWPGGHLWARRWVVVGGGAKCLDRKGLLGRSTPYDHHRDTERALSRPSIRAQPHLEALMWCKTTTRGR